VLSQEILGTSLDLLSLVSALPVLSLQKGP